MNEFWIIKVTYHDGCVGISSDGYRKIEDARKSLDDRLGGEVHWISDFICRQIIDEKVIYYELHNINILR
jgi:hypothetical protein